VAADDEDFIDQARRAAEEIPRAEFISIEGKDHSAWTPPVSTPFFLRCCERFGKRRTNALDTSYMRSSPGLELIAQARPHP